jgi:tetratricopeptide (TPR) repeat protein
MSTGKLRNAADGAFAKGEIDEAAKLWGKVIEQEPSNEQNYYKRFRVYLRLQKFKEALQDLTSAINIKPDYPEALAQRGKLSLRFGKCNEAEKDFQALKR